MDFSNYLKEAAAEVDRELADVFSKWSAEVQAVSSKLVELNNEFIQASQGGKRLRGALVKLGYEMALAEDYGQARITDREIMKAAAAFEIFQTAILSHDDVIDQSAIRRGRPTLYQALGGNHYGVSQTICLGDIGYFLALRVIAKSDFADELKIRAVRLFAQAMLDTALGQLLDVELPNRQTPKEEADALTVFRLKTARYTIVGPLQLGAVLAGADRKLLGEIENFGESLGTAFQIQDDILGVFGDEKTLGKSVTSDIEEGKNTLLVIEALKKAAPDQREVLDKVYGKGKINQSQLEQIRRIFTETGALEYSRKRAEEMVEEAKKTVERMEIPANKKQLLSEMAEFLVERQK